MQWYCAKRIAVFLIQLNARKYKCASSITLFCLLNIRTNIILSVKLSRLNRCIDFDKIRHGDAIFLKYNRYTHRRSSGKNVVNLTELMPFLFIEYIKIAWKLKAKLLFILRLQLSYTMPLQWKICSDAIRWGYNFCRHHEI